MARPTTKRPLGSYLVFLAPVPFFTFGYGFIHSAWIPLQDGSDVSVAIQAAAALGTVLAMGMLLLLIAYFWGPKKLELYPLLVLFVFGLMLYINAAFQDMLPALYVITLNIAQKITLFLVLLSPFLVPVRHSSLGVAAAAAALYTAGRFGATLAVSSLDASLHPVLLLGAVVIAGISVVAGLMLNSGASEKPAAKDGKDALESPAPKKPEFAPAPQTEASGEPLATDPDEAQHRVAACDQLARSHGLTNRERETLYLLAQGMTATAIAEALTVSTYTVKSHIRSIYAKLEVHSRNELLVMIHRG